MKPVPLRELTADEIGSVEKLAHSRTEAVRRVEGARLIWAVYQGEARSALAARLGVDPETVRSQVLRFNAEGLASFNDKPPTYSADEVATVIATALTNPKSLELPFVSWTLDRLAAYLHLNGASPILGHGRIMNAARTGSGQDHSFSRLVRQSSLETSAIAEPH